MSMKTKPMTEKKRTKINLSMTKDAVAMLKEISSSMGMTQSGFVEFMVRQVARADKVPMGQMVQETLEVFMKK